MAALNANFLAPISHSLWLPICILFACVMKLATGLSFSLPFSLMDGHYLYLGQSLPLIMGHWELYSTLSLLGTFFFLYFSLFSSAHYGGKW